jgi:hypothetical protein
MKKIIASWESRGGKCVVHDPQVLLSLRECFVKLYRDDYGYGYEGNGCDVSFGNLPTDEAAIDYVENKVNPYCQASANKRKN